MFEFEFIVIIYGMTYSPMCMCHKGIVSNVSIFPAIILIIAWITCANAHLDLSPPLITRVYLSSITSLFVHCLPVRLIDRIFLESHVVNSAHRRPFLSRADG